MPHSPNRTGNGTSPQESSQHTRRLLQQLVGERNTLTLHKFIIDLCDGDHLKALLLEQLMYWSERSRSDDGEVAKSDADWHDEIRLSPRQMRRIREWLKTSGVADVARKRSAYYGGQPVYHYVLDWKVLEAKITGSLTQEPAKNASSELTESESSELNGPASSEGNGPASSFNTEPTQSLQKPRPADAGSVSAEGKSRYKSFAEQHPDLFDAELEDTKRAAVADLVADGAKRYINNTLKDQLERTVAHIFQTGGGEARVIARMLRGRPKKDDGQAWHDAAADFIDAEVDSDELLAWAQWYERKNPDTTLPKTPHKLAGSILYWRENAKRESSRTGSEYYGGYKIVG